MNKPARFTQAELRRAIRAAKAEGARLAVRNGVIEIDPTKPPEDMHRPSTDDRREVAPGKEFHL